jgi:predicted branched-subunit amino acid permease
VISSNIAFWAEFHVSANLTWFISTVAGGIGGLFIPEGALGIDYALIAMFICLLIYQIRKLIYLLTAVVLTLMILGNTYIVIASIVAATVGGNHPTESDEE